MQEPNEVGNNPERHHIQLLCYETAEQILGRMQRAMMYTETSSLVKLVLALWIKNTYVGQLVCLLLSQ